MADPILVVVESPAKQKTIAKILGPGYLVRATVGHIMDLAKSKEHRLGVDIDNGFAPKYSVIPDKRDKIAAIIDAAKQSSQVYIASDPDREGEAIAWHVADQIKATNKPIKRVMFKQITKQGIQQGIQNAGALDKNLYDSQQARRVLDRLVGFMVSPYLWQSFGPNLSAGRVQSVCLRLIVDREREIEAFVPEIYWAISANLAKLKDKADKFVARYPTRITNEQQASSIKTDLESSTFVVGNVEAKEMRRNPPPPLTTSRLQQIAASRFKFPTKKTMSAAQSLYEAGHVTYIRTDSTRSDPGAIADLRSFLSKNKYDIPKVANEYKAKGTAQDAHEAIRPTDVSLHPDSFVGTDDQSKVYRLAWEHFVASQMMPAVYDTVAVTIIADCKTRKHELKANGRTLKYAGWLAVLQDNESKKEDEVTLPILIKSEEVTLVPPKVQSEKKQTQPPPRYNEGSLVKELDKRGIGRPSTYSAIIGKISDRNYVTKSKNVFTPSEIGCRVIDDLTKHFKFMEYEYTKAMENKLDKIEVGDIPYVQMLSEFFDPFKAELKSARLSQDKDGGHDCDKCGKRMKLKHGRFGYYIACSGHPQCKNTQSVELDGDKVNLKTNQQVIVAGVLCPECGVGMSKRDGKFGPFYSCSAYPKCKGTRKIPFGKPCPKCSSDLFMTAFKGEPKLACMGYPNCKHVEDIPPGTKVNWLDPQTLKRKPNKKVDRYLNK